MAKNTTTKKSRFGFMSGLRKLFKPRLFSAYFLCVLSVLPVIVIFWFSVPTFSLFVNNQWVQVTSILNELNLTVSRYGLYEGYDLQGGVSLEYSIEREKLTSTGSTTVGTGSGTSTGISTTGTGTNTIDYQNNKQRTISIFEQRLSAVNLPDSKLYSLLKPDGSSEVIANINGTRESIGFNLPIFLRLKGQVEIWIDDPNYKPDEENQNSLFNPTEGKVKTSIEDNEILGAEVVNDYKTGGWGVKLHFADSAVGKLSTASQDIGKGSQPYGFMIVIDGVPAAYQSAQYTTTDPKGIYFSTSGTDYLGMKALSATINSENLPLSLSAVSNNNVITPVSRVNMDLLKLSLFLGFVIFNVIILSNFKIDGVLVVIFNISVLTFVVLFLRLTRQVLTIELISSVIAGLSMTSLIQIQKMTDLIEARTKKSIEGIKSIGQNYRKLYSKFLIIPVVTLAILWTFDFSINIAGLVFVPFALIFAVSLFVEGTVSRTFTNILFLVPITNGKEETKGK